MTAPSAFRTVVRVGDEGGGVDGTTIPADSSDLPVAEVDFADWVAPHWIAMQRLASRLVPVEERDDLLQESLLRAWRKWHTFDADRGSPRNWLLAVLADRARKTWTRSASSDEGGPAADRATDDRLPDVDLRRAVAALSGRRRLAVELHYYLGMTVVEVASVMGCAEGTVKATLSAARGDLRRQLGDRDTEETR